MIASEHVKKLEHILNLSRMKQILTILLSLSFFSNYIQFIKDNLMSEASENQIVVVRMRIQIDPDLLKAITNMDRFGDINMDQGMWNRHKVSNVASIIERWNVKDTLYLHGNYEPQLLKQIFRIKFPYLRKLHIWANNIESIQLLGSMEIPNLEFIQFCDNHITSFGSVRKATFPKLKFIQFCSNKGQQLSSLQEIHAPNLEQVILEMNDKDQILCQNILWSFKLQSRKMKEIWAKNISRIINNRQTLSLQKKYTDISLYFNVQ